MKTRDIVIIFSAIILLGSNQISYAQDIDSLDYFRDDGYDVFTATDGVKKFYFPYELEHGEIKNISFSKDAGTIIVMIEVQEETKMSFIIPRVTYDSTFNGNLDEAFVLADGKEIFPEMIVTSEFRTFVLDVKEDFTELEFILGHVPESELIFLEIDQSRVFSELSSPHEQIKMNILPSEVTCNGDLTLILKSTDGSPACVKPSTAEKLVERGWAKP